jgi:hypothetical protein
MYWIVAAKDIVFPFRESRSFRFMSESLNLRFVSINRVFIVYIGDRGFLRVVRIVRFLRILTLGLQLRLFGYRILLMVLL